MRKATLSGLIIIAFCAQFMINASAHAQTAFGEETLVRQRCSACHKLDQKGRMEVIEETRKTPEEWKVVVDRMIRINGAPLEDAEFGRIIKELSWRLCLSPAEMAEVAYLNSDENSQYRELPTSELEMNIMGACARCHTFGKIKSHRMTRAQWGETKSLHLGYYPTAVMQMREMDWVQVFEDLLDPLSQLYAFDDPRWIEWMKNRQEQDLTGQWRIAGYQPGLGYYEGAYTFALDPSKGDDEYLIDRRVRYENGMVLKTSGTGTLYSEFHLRYALAPTALTGRIEGVFDLNAAESGFTGRWWTLVQDSNSYGDEKFYKVGSPARVFAAYPGALEASEGASHKLTLIGTGLPQGVEAEDIIFSDPGVKVEKIEEAGTSKIVCLVSASPGSSGKSVELTVKGVKCDKPIHIYEGLDGIKIIPALGRARVSCGAAYPPHGVQFVARGWDFGPDNQPGTADDVLLEPIDAVWELEEEVTRENDDDLKYLRAPINNGLYTPVTTYGPIAEREQSREGVGLIAVKASYNDGDRMLGDRALLAVTPPDFIPQIK
jgi:quinohemoprotein amine dehydrogenase alpha subunit